MLDLWPPDIGKEKTRSPKLVLKEQADLLGQKTQNLIKASVWLDDKSRSTYDFVYRFDIVSTALGGYRYRLFTIRHDIDLYPVRMDIDEDILAEFGTGSDEIIIAESEESLLEILKTIFGSVKTRKIITALLSQIESP